MLDQEPAARVRMELTEADRIQKQIIFTLREHEAGVATADLYHKRGSRVPASIPGGAKFGSIDASDAQLGAENAS